eukprot:scaffold71434_cov79-Phaeocystis_antarctica.AAC.3
MALLNRKTNDSLAARIRGIVRSAATIMAAMSNTLRSNAAAAGGNVGGGAGGGGAGGGDAGGNGSGDGGGFWHLSLPSGPSTAEHSSRSVSYWQSLSARGKGGHAPGRTLAPRRRSGCTTYTFRSASSRSRAP